MLSQWNNSSRFVLMILTFVVGAGTAWGGDSGFLSDYSLLKPSTDAYQDLYHEVPDLLEKLQSYDAIMVDQPEIFIADDSRYKGMKPDDMKLIADTFRDIMLGELGEDYRIVEDPGPGVLYLRIAFSDMFVKRKMSKNPLSYTPVGAVLKATKNALTKNIMKKISLVEAKMEVELLDSRTGEVLGAVVEKRGRRKDKKIQQKADPANWDELVEVFHVGGRRLSCRFSNARLPVAQRVDCMQIASD